MRRSIVSKRPGRKLGGCLTHHWNGVLVTASTVPKHQTRGKSLVKRWYLHPCCCSCSVSLGRNSLDLTRIWKVCSPVTSMYDEVFLGPVSPLFWSLSYWSCPGSRNYHWYSKTIWPGQMCDVWHCFSCTIAVDQQASNPFQSKQVSFGF